MFDQLQRIKDVQELTARIDPRLFGIAILVSLLASLFAGWLYRSALAFRVSIKRQGVRV